MKVYKFGGTSVGTAKRMAEVARIIGLVLSNPGKVEAQKEAAARVAVLCDKHPLYPNL